MMKPLGDQARVIVALFEGRRLRAGLPRVESALAALESRGDVVLFPKPALTTQGEQRARALLPLAYA